MTDHPSPETTRPETNSLETSSLETSSLETSSLGGTSPRSGAPDTGSSLDHERERLARIALTQLIEPARSTWSEVIGEHHSATDVYRAVLNGTIDEIIREAMSKVAADAFARARLADQLARVDPDAILDHAAGRGYRYVIPGDPEWPSQLDRLTGQRPVHRATGAPLGLWVRGLLSLEALHDAVTVTGSREPTSYGIDFAGPARS